MFNRIRYLLAAFDRGDITLDELSVRLDRHVDARAQEPRPSRHLTSAGLAPVRATS